MRKIFEEDALRSYLRRGGRTLLAMGAAALVAGSLALATGATAAAVAAQEEEADCRCVDSDGNEIENCTCFRTPHIENLMSRVAVFGDDRPRLGIGVEVRPDEGEEVAGARVTDVLEGGPAEEAGLREGDVITHLDGQSLSEPIESEAEQTFDLDGSIPAQRLLALARDLEPGQSVEIQYLRDGQRQTTMVEAEDLSDRWGRFKVVTPSWDAELLGERLRGLSEQARAWRYRMEPDAGLLYRGQVPRGDARVFEGPGAGFLLGGTVWSRGLQLVEVNPSLGSYFGVESGVLVTDVSRSSTLGLEAGDVVVSVGSRTVSTPEQLRRILASYAEDEQIELGVVRDGEEITVTAPMRD